MNSTKRGFTLLELLTVIGMIALIMGSMTVSIASANRRASIQKAETEVKAVTQAVLAYENYAPTTCDQVFGRLNNNDGVECSKSSIGFLLGDGGKSEFSVSEKIPVLLMAALTSGGQMLDPWGTPYRIRIRPGQVKIQSTTAASAMSTGYVLPNFYRLSKEERE